MLTKDENGVKSIPRVVDFIAREVGCEETDPEPGLWPRIWTELIRASECTRKEGNYWPSFPPSFFVLPRRCATSIRGLEGERTECRTLIPRSARPTIGKSRRFESMEFVTTTTTASSAKRKKTSPSAPVPRRSGSVATPRRRQSVENPSRRGIRRAGPHRGSTTTCSFSRPRVIR